jgi:hypothetical protein
METDGWRPAREIPVSSTLTSVRSKGASVSPPGTVSTTEAMGSIAYAVPAPPSQHSVG